MKSQILGCLSPRSDSAIYNGRHGKDAEIWQIAAAADRAARVDLAAAFRLAVRMDLHEGVCNHFTLMLPDGRKAR